MRILQGVAGQAGQPFTLAKAFRKLGYDAQSVSIVDHPFGYERDELIQNVNLRDPLQLRDLVEELADRFDIFHFHGRAFAPFLPNLSFPCFNDLSQLRRLGKKTFFHFRGGELRERQKFAELNPFAYSYEKDSDQLFGSQSDESKRLMKRVISDLCTDVFVVDNELSTYLPSAKIIPRAIDLAQWEYTEPRIRDKPLVIHAPSRRLVKGTDYVLKAVEDLKAQGLNFEFYLVEGLSNAEAREVYKEADIVIDQLRIGWYGVLAVEAMALGKTVIAYMREDLLNIEQDEVPVLNANPNTIKALLEQAIRDRTLREQISLKAREYVERVHCSEAVCRRLIDAYKTPNRFDLAYSMLDLHDYQRRQFMEDEYGPKGQSSIGEKALLKKIDSGHGPIPTTTRAKLRNIRRIIKSSLPWSSR